MSVCFFLFFKLLLLLGNTLAALPKKTMWTAQFKHKRFQNDPHMINSIDETSRKRMGRPPMCDIKVCSTHYTSSSFTPAFILTVRGVTGAMEQTHKFMGFWQLV